MPLFKVINNDDVNLAIWQINESADELMSLFRSLEFDVLPKTPVRHAETWKNKLAARVALGHLLERLNGGCSDIEVSYDEHGKLHLDNYPGEVSISHCRGWAAAVLSHERDVGVDIEILGDRAPRIRQKFCSTDELQIFGGRDDIHLVWGAKEAMYKAYGKRQLIFKEDMNIRHDASTDTVSGQLMKNGAMRHYSVYHEKILQQVLLVYVKQQ